MTHNIVAIFPGDEHLRNDPLFASTLFRRDRLRPDIGSYAIVICLVLLDCGGAM